MNQNEGIPDQHQPDEGKMREHFDLSSLIVIAVTFILFAFALFTKGFTHDLLLEAGVFLVSVKLIVMAYKNSMTNKRIAKELQTIKEMLADREHKP